MAKLEFKKLNPKRTAGKHKQHVSLKRVKDRNGCIKVLRIIDAGSETLRDDLRHVFSLNVVKARKDNKQKIGSSDVVPAKA